MNRRQFFGTSTAVSAASLLPAAADARQPAANRDRSKKILFWDLSKLDYWDNIELVQGEPAWQPDASYIDPFEGGKRGGNFPVVWQDAESDRWRMIYSVKWSPYTMMLAESDDGRNWTPLPQPSIDPPGGKLASNHIHTIAGAGAGGVFVDPAAADGYPFKVWARQHSDVTFERALADPNHYWHKAAKADGEQRYMNEGITVVSRDGLHWEEKPEYAWDFPGWRPEPPLFVFRHHQQARYGMTVRPGWGDRRTCIRFTDGDDFTSFGDPEMLFQPDALDTDHVKGFYGMPVFPCGEGYVGLLWTFHNSSSRPVNSFNQFFGVMDAELTTSYDGVRWNRTRLGTFLKRNPMGEHGCMQLRPSCLVEADNEIRIYAEASKAAHGLERSLGKQLEEPTKSIELFTLRRDGYLYLRSQGDWARFQTKPIALWTPEITMNADARYGEIRFQLTDEKSQPIEGFTFDDCVPFRRSNAFDQQLLWKNAKLDAVIGKVIRLEIELRNAELFSFTAAHHFLDAQDKWLLLDGKEIDTRLFDY